MAGVGKIEYKRFFVYNVFGGLIWTTMLPYLGHYFGKVIPDADKIILPVVAGIIIISFLPAFFTVLRDKERRKNIKNKIKLIIKKK
jgi:membrane-associated protein